MGRYILGVTLSLYLALVHAPHLCWYAQKTLRRKYKALKAKIIASLKSTPEASGDGASPRSAHAAMSEETGQDTAAGRDERKPDLRAAFYAKIDKMGIWPVPNTGLLFADVSRRDADQGVLLATKYLINNFFQLFGTEVGSCGVALGIMFTSTWLLSIIVCCPLCLMSRIN